MESKDIIAASEAFCWPEDKNKILDYYKNTSNISCTESMYNMILGPINKDYISSSEKILNQGIYEIPPYGIFQYKNYIDWSENPTNTISFMRALHGHFFIADIVYAYKENKKTDYIKKAYEIIEDWILKNPFDNPQNPMAWHDEGTSVRLKIWILFFDEARKILSNDELAFLITNIRYHADLLASSEFHSDRTNHGMFQDQALLIYSDYFNIINGSKDLSALACARIEDYINFIYSKEGIHLEHAPGYHFIMSGELKSFADYLTANNNDHSGYFSDLYDKTAKYATYIIKPDGFLPQVSDTSKRVNLKIYWKDNMFYKFSANQGNEGDMPLETDVVFPEAGYAIFRSSWTEKEKATYILFIAAYHCTYHKHCDDLSLWIYSDGDIITEAGHYNYDMDDRFTQYTYSSFAHNCLIVDDKGLPRIDGKHNLVRLTNYDIKGDTVNVTGINERYTDTKHTRTVEYRKRFSKIKVTDKIESGQIHKYQLLWNLAIDIEPMIQGDTVYLYKNKIIISKIQIEASADFHIYNLSAQVEPVIIGWYCPEVYSIKPVNTLVIDTMGKDVNVITSFDIG